MSHLKCKSLMSHNEPPLSMNKMLKISDGKFWDFCRSEVLQSSSLKIPVLADGGFLSEMLIKIPVFCMNNQNSVQSEGSVEPKVMPSWSPGT